MDKGFAIMESCFQWFKDTNLKANHNRKHPNCDKYRLFPMVQRY